MTQYKRHTARGNGSGMHCYVAIIAASSVALNSPCLVAQLHLLQPSSSVPRAGITCQRLNVSRSNYNMPTGGRSVRVVQSFVATKIGDSMQDKFFSISDACMAPITFFLL